MSNSNNVIPFPGKPKKPKRLSPEEQRRATTATIGFILFLMLGFNFSMFEIRKENAQRGIASVPAEYGPLWKENLSHMNKSKIARSAKKPSTVESLNFGPLAGQYAMRLEKGFITSIELAKSDNPMPQTVSDRSALISEYATAFMPDFLSADQLKFERENDGYKETFRVFRKGGESMFEFHLDGQKRFVSLRIK